MLKKFAALVVVGMSFMFSAPVFAEDTAQTAETVILYVDINNDSAEKMSDLLKGIGLKKAQAIVDFRSEHGLFTAPEDLLEVPGIGPATLEKNRNAIVFGETEN
jgi:competence protein ComEA